MDSRQPGDDGESKDATRADAVRPAAESGEPTVDSLFEQCFGRSEAQWQHAIDEACARHPGHAEELLRRWSVLGGLAAGPAPRAGPGASDRIGKFRLVRQLGSGGMGVVHLAEDESLGRRVALKLIRPEYMSLEWAKARFRREVEAASKLDDPGICTVYEAGEIDGYPYLAMQFVEGETLDAKIAARAAAAAGTTAATGATTGKAGAPGGDSRRRGSGFTREQILADVELIERAARSIHEAHEHGLVHRDIKPGNIMLTPAGDPVILDFGLVRMDREQFGALTVSGELLGTPAYMAPEQIEPRGRSVDRRTDVYALGVTLYECLTLRLPFTGHSIESLSRQILAGTALRPTVFNPKIKPDLVVVLQAAMDVDPGRRYRTALEFADDLRRVRRLEPIRAKPASVWLKLRRWTQRSPVVATALALLIVSLAGMSWLYVRLADAHAGNMRLGDMYRLDEHRKQADALWPALPANVPGMEQWLTDTADVPDLLAFHRGWLAREAGADGQDRNARFVRDSRAELIQALERFLEMDVPEMQRRLAEARTIRARSIDAYRARWDEAIAAIAAVGVAPAYGSLELPEQIGLCPLGPDPENGLWEFAHLPSGAVPERDADTGRLRVTADMGLVFVLVPGGRAVLGARRSAAEALGGEHVDPLAQVEEAPDEGALVAVELAPFFLSKYEMTQAQWRRVTGASPSYVTPQQHGSLVSTDLLPVESISWLDAHDALARLGLELPTEAQWEYAARGGTAGPRWTGDDPGAIGAGINLADASFHGASGYADRPYESGVDDGFAIHAPVDALRPSPFGLCHVLGNVHEWCRDGYDQTWRMPRAAGTGALQAREGIEPDYRVYRGGSIFSTLGDVRVTRRWYNEPKFSSYLIGVRPAQGVRR